MTPTQRAAAERLSNERTRVGGQLWGAEVVALLRELLAEPVQKPAQKKPSTASQFESVKEAKKVAEAQLSYYRKMMADKSADPVVNQQITGVPIATNPLRISVTRGLRRFRTKQRNARS